MFGLGAGERSRKSTVKKKIKDYREVEDFDKPEYK